VFWLEDEKGRVLVRHRVQGSLLSGLSDFPWSETAGGASAKASAGADANANANASASANAGTEASEILAWPVQWEFTQHSIRHTFTHFHLTLTVVRGNVNSESFIRFAKSSDTLTDSAFVGVTDFSQYPFSRLMQKVIEVMAVPAAAL
jgi:A/G-specific adenine glycosylase